MVSKSSRRLLRVALGALSIIVLASLVSYSKSRSAQSGNGPNGNAYGYVVKDNTPLFVSGAVDQGSADPNAVISVTVWLKLHNESQLHKLVQQLYDKKSPSFHKWINQQQFNANFSPTSQEVNAVQNFLAAHGLSVIAVAENNFFVKVQGTIGQIEQTFHVSIHNFTFNGSSFRSNTGDPEGNDSSFGLIAAVTGLDDVGFEPAIARPIESDGTVAPMIPLGMSPNGLFFESQCFRAAQAQTFTNPATSTTATYTGNRFGADITNNTLGHLPPCGFQPSELQTAYNMTPLYKAGFDGSGETIAITEAYGSTTIAQDAEIFSTVYNLPELTLEIVKAPGLANNPHGVARNWDIETTLDVEWAHALAPGAHIALVIATDHSSLDEAINYAVVHHLGNTISNSWSRPEGLGNPAQFNRVNRILEQAVVQGIDVNFASGDCGDQTVLVPGFCSPLPFKTVAFPASSPFATGVGGTSLVLNSDDSINFQTGWGNNLTRIANRVSEGSTPVNPPLQLGFQGGAGGGSSVTFAKPAFQSGLPGNVRLVPDISMVADPFTGVELIQTVGGVTGVSVIGGTSVGAPTFSAVMAIAAQKAGHGLGQAAALVYSLPAGAVADVAPVGSANNVTGSITTPSGTTNFTADQLAAPLFGTTTYFSALYNSPFSTRWFVITFGTDTSLETAAGWDNVTGVGTPNGQAFVGALAP